MKINDILKTLQEDGTGICISSNNSKDLMIRTNESDRRAGKILEFCYNELVSRQNGDEGNMTIGELEQALSDAVWWLKLIGAIVEA